MDKCKPSFGAAFLVVRGEMRELILNCARRVKKDTLVKRAFLRAIGIELEPEDYFTIHVDESADIRECFENRRRVML